MVEATSNRIDSKYRFILLAAKRARQLQAGAKPLVHTTAHKPTRIAQEELRAGLLNFEYMPLPGTEPKVKEPPPPTPTKGKKKKA
ncbi:MAG: DNA-directed RNA polymerase subunit omega [Acidobacteria bacterium RIFCSPLOWO2_12_FULL_54_10]|nr:MAG: DNA-directed RNA polymerase subunit omega [Acidobacteria bacterium RIFCSPLOWO2_12_FULL_54_10]